MLADKCLSYGRKKSSERRYRNRDVPFSTSAIFHQTLPPPPSSSCRRRVIDTFPDAALTEQRVVVSSCSCGCSFRYGNEISLTTVHGRSLAQRVLRIIMGVGYRRRSCRASELSCRTDGNFASLQVYSRASLQSRVLFSTYNAPTRSRFCTTFTVIRRAINKLHAILR